MCVRLRACVYDSQLTACGRAQVMWLDVSMSNETYCSLYGGHRALVDQAVLNSWRRGDLKAAIVQSTPAAP